MDFSKNEGCGELGQDFSKNEGWGELGHRLRSFHPKLFTLTDMSAHPMG